MESIDLNHPLIDHDHMKNPNKDFRKDFLISFIKHNFKVGLQYIDETARLYYL